MKCMSVAAVKNLGSGNGCRAKLLFLLKLNQLVTYPSHCLKKQGTNLLSFKSATTGMSVEAASDMEGDQNLYNPKMDS